MVDYQGIPYKMKKTTKVNIADLVREQMKRYGTATIEERALPDYHDGLKPVQRRILWAVHELKLRATSNPIKCARIVGDVLGKYHPHGDMATYDTMVRMVWFAEPLLDGTSSNFGSISDNAAAYRYTDTRPTKFAELNFFNPDYVRVTRTVPNFDGMEKEPYVMPSLLPHVLINGSYGIAVGTTGCVPGFEVPGLAKLVVMILKNEEVTPQICYENLEFRYAFGGGCVDKKAQKKELLRLYKTGIASIKFTSKYVWDQKKRTMRYVSFAPNVNPEALCERLSGVVRQKKKSKKPPRKPRANKFDFVQSARDDTGKGDLLPAYVITLKPGDPKETLARRQAVDKEWSSALHYKMNVTNRTWNKEKETYDTKFFKTNVIDLLKKWTKWRIQLELKALNRSLVLKDSDIAYTKLLILAAANRDFIIGAIKKNAKDYAALEQLIAKGLKITLDQAKQILDLRIRQLSKIDENLMKDKLKKQQEEAATLKKYIKKPEDKVIADVQNFVKCLQ